MAAMNTIPSTGGTAANASYDVIEQHRGEDSGVFVIHATAGTWANAVVTPQYSFDGTNYLTCFAPGGTTAVTAITVDGFLRVSIPLGCKFRLTVTLAEAGTATLAVYVARLHE